jgi:hypothetical protein
LRDEDVLKRAIAWFCLLAGALLNIELVLTAGRVNFVWLLLLVLAVSFFQRNGWSTPANKAKDDEHNPESDSDS